MYAHILPLAALLLGPVNPVTGGSPRDTSGERADEERHWYTPLNGSVTLESYVGIGTFAANDKADAPFYLATLYLDPSWSLSENLSVAAQLWVSHEFTNLVTGCSPATGPRPDEGPQRDCSDTGEQNGRRTDVTDLAFTINHGDLFGLIGLDALGTRLSVSTGVALPTSRASRGARNLFTWTAAAQVSRSFGPVTPSLGTTLWKFFPRARAPKLPTNDPNQDGVPVRNCASFRAGQCILLPGFVSNFQWGLDASVNVDVGAIDGLSATISFGYLYSRSFGTGGDAFSSPLRDSEGRRVVDGVNESDTTSGTIDISYQITDTLSASAGVFSLQPARTADGRQIRFPFYDFVSPANNFTGWYLSVSHSL